MALMGQGIARAALALVGVGALAAAGCASTPPPRESLSQAELSLEEAQQAGAQQHAPLELYQAREQLEQAKRAMEEEEHVRARRLAESALASARLASTRARTAEAQRDAEAMEQNIETLRAELAGARDTRRAEEEP